MIFNPIINSSSSSIALASGSFNEASVYLYETTFYSRQGDIFCNKKINKGFITKQMKKISSIKSSIKAGSDTNTLLSENSAKLYPSGI
jgi:hypothetical protein